MQQVYLKIGILSFCIFIFLRCSSSTDPAPANNSPTISSLTASPDSVEVNETSDISCIASDPDGDKLIYTWEASNGIVNGSGENVTWTAPNTSGTYSISCKVDDGNGGQDIESINIVVISINAPPNITSLTANPDSIFVNQLSNLTCTADDPDNDNLNYNWQALAGTINGTGSTVTWNAPSSEGTYTITCQVDDGNGGEDIDSINIVVEQQLPTQGLLAYWPFNGNANDESGNGNNGSVIGPSLTTDRFGISNRAYSFDGINDYIDIGNNVKPDFPMSVSAWVYNTDINPGSFGQGTIFRNDFWDHTSSYYGVNIKNWSGSLLAQIGNGGIAAPWSRFDVVTNDVVFSENDWFNVVVVFISPQTMNLYVNGEEAEASSGSGTASSRAYSGANGAIGFSRDQQFAGKIDDIRVYERSLSEEEIQALYHEGGWGE